MTYFFFPLLNFNVRLLIKEIMCLWWNCVAVYGNEVFFFFLFLIRAYSLLSFATYNFKDSFGIISFNFYFIKFSYELCMMFVSLNPEILK